MRPDTTRPTAALDTPPSPPQLIGSSVEPAFHGRYRALTSPRVLPVLATFVLFVVMFGAGSARYDNFFSLQVLLNLFVDNAYLIVLAVGMTFVIITGGIDLSVGSVVALSGVLAATMPLRATTAPTDRSMPPVRITNVMPTTSTIR